MLDATEMLEVTKVSEGTKLIVTTSGRVDTDTAEFFDGVTWAMPTRTATSCSWAAPTT